MSALHLLVKTLSVLTNLIHPLNHSLSFFFHVSTVDSFIFYSGVKLIHGVNLSLQLHLYSSVNM